MIHVPDSRVYTREYSITLTDIKEDQNLEVSSGPLEPIYEPADLMRSSMDQVIDLRLEGSLLVIGWVTGHGNSREIDEECLSVLAIRFTSFGTGNSEPGRVSYESQSESCPSRRTSPIRVAVGIRVGDSTCFEASLSRKVGRRMMGGAEAALKRRE